MARASTTECPACIQAGTGMWHGKGCLPLACIQQSSLPGFKPLISKALISNAYTCMQSIHMQIFEVVD